MTAALAVLIAAGTLAGELDLTAGIGATTRAGRTPLAAGLDPIGQVRIEAEPSLGLLYSNDSNRLALSYRPRVVQRFLLGSVVDPITGQTRTASVTGPLIMHQFDLSGRFRPTPRLGLDTGLALAVGEVPYNDSNLFLANDNGDPGTSSDATVLNVLGRASAVYITDSDRDSVRVGATVALSRILDDAAVTTGVLDRTRLGAFATYTFNPTRVDAVELSMNSELSFYPESIGRGGVVLAATQAGLVGATGGLVRQFSQRVRCAARAGAVALFSTNDPLFVPSGGADCTLDTYRSPGLRITGSFSAAVIGATSGVTVAAEPRVVAGTDFRFLFPPDKSLRIGAVFSGPIRVDDAIEPPENVTDSYLQITTPFAWQIQPGLDVIVGASLGVRGRLDGAFDQVDLQGFVSVAYAFGTENNSRYQR